MTVSPHEHDLGWKPSFNPWIISISVMLATFMEVLDTSIANVALPHIAGSMSATTEEATWVLTSYLISNAIILPTTGWLSRYFGRKNFLIGCIILFTIASAFCGAATSLGMLIVARVLQGAGGGALQPIAQAVMLESFPHNKRGLAMAVYGMGVVVAPIIGPTLGGWITDAHSWRWSFYINVPIGIIAVLMAQTFVEDPPYIRSQRATRIDYVGFGFMAVWLATLQIFLDKGQQEDWFASNFIVTLAIISCLTFLAFVIWELRVDQPIVDLRILLNRNFTLGILMIFALGAVLYATIALLPLLLQTVLGYSAYRSGLTLSPRGFGSMFAMILVGRIIGIVDTRWLMALGFVLLGWSAFMFGGFDLNISMRSVIWPNIVNGMSTGLIFVPLTTICMGTLPNEQMGNATGIYNLMRNLGGGFGISAVTTMLARSAQSHQSTLAAHMNAYNPAYTERLQSYVDALTPHLGHHAAVQAAHGMIYEELVKQANLWSYVADFRLLGYLCLACAPLMFLFKRVKPKPGAVAAH